jgi:hypothetical protein
MIPKAGVPKQFGRPALLAGLYLDGLDLRTDGVGDDGGSQEPCRERARVYARLYRRSDSVLRLEEADQQTPPLKFRCIRYSEIREGFPNAA